MKGARIVPLFDRMTARASRPLIPLVSFLAVVLVGMHAYADTIKCGAICTETWDLVGSPYIVTCDTTVGAGCTLTIDAGVEVRFQAATDLTIEGTPRTDAFHGGVTVVHGGATVEPGAGLRR